MKQFEEDSLTAQSLEDLADCAAELLPYVNGDRQHMMGRALRNRAENAWTDAEKRIAQSATRQPQDQQEEEETPRDRLLMNAREVAEAGSKKLRFFLGKLSVEERELLTDEDIQRLEAAAARAEG